MEYPIRPLSSYDDFKACEQLQSEVFGYQDIEIIPYQLLQSFTHAGGIVLGAFDHDSLIGTAIGYTGLSEDGNAYHRSQRLAVLSRYRGQGVGENLKRAQAKVAQQHGLKVMCWTYDPLRSVNAYLNIHKLGALSNRYIEQMYTVSSSPFDAGVSIDRLWVEWRLDGPVVNRSLNLEQAISTGKAKTVLSNQEDRPSQLILEDNRPIVVIQIPANIETVRENSLDRLIAWRSATRQAFTYYFAHKYQVHDYLIGAGYVLIRMDD